MQKMISFLLFVFLSLSVLSAADAQTKVATDPMRVGVGARPLGMGKSFVGLADDTSSIFLNPAGLAGITDWQATSMSGKFINEYDYLNLGLAYPTRFGVIGLGYVGGNISFRSPSVTTEAIDGVRIIPSSSEGSVYSFGNNVVSLSWGRELRGLFKQEFFDHLSAGATLKFFSLNLSGVGISNGTASGNELDLGLHYKPNTIFRAGAVLQNGLPFSAGGKIKWANGTEESLPSVLKLGLSFKVLGQEGMWTKDEHEVSINFDQDFYPNRGGLPQLWHLGAEWSPLELLDIRLGIDQETVGTGSGGLDVSNNLTAGVGLYFSDLRFDYAFHQYNNLTANDTHYFSLSYGVRPKEEGDYILIGSPRYGEVAYLDQVELTGEALRRDVDHLIIQNKKVDLGRDRKFRIVIGLEFGRNIVPIKIVNRRGRIVEELNWKIVRLVSFKDVGADYWSKLQIEYLATLGIISGYPDGTFRPEAAITRAEITTLIVKTQKGAYEGLGTRFKDITKKHWAAKYVAGAVSSGLVQGYPDDTFRPNKSINRVEGLTIITRFAGLTDPRELVAPYKDIPSRYWGLRAIAAAKQSGYLDYIVGDYFYPKAELKRGEVAYLLFKTGPVQSLIRRKL